MSTVTISMAGIAALQRGFAEAPAFTRNELLVTMVQATLLVERESKERMPRGSTGLTAASITSDAWSTSLGVFGVVGSSMASASFIELGTKPHMPPVQALIPWVRDVLGVDAKRAPSVAYLVARKIARKGTKAQKPFELAIAASAPTVQKLFEASAARVAEHLAGTGGAA